MSDLSVVAVGSDKRHLQPVAKAAYMCQQMPRAPSRSANATRTRHDLFSAGVVHRTKANQRFLYAICNLEICIGWVAIAS